MYSTYMLHSLLTAYQHLQRHIPYTPQTLIPRNIRLIDVNAKCRHLKKLTCKQNLSAGVYQSGDSQLLAYIQSCWYFQPRQPIACIHLVMLVFSTQLLDLYSPLLPISPSLQFNSSLPSPIWGSGPQSDKHLPESPLQVNFFR